MVKFFETLKEFISYDEEVFPCELVVSSNINNQHDTEEGKVSSPKLYDSYEFQELQTCICCCSH